MPKRLIKAVLKKSFEKRGKTDISNFSKVRDKKARLAHLPLSNMIHEFSSALQLHRNPTDLLWFVNLIPGSSDCFYRGSLDTQGQPTPWSHLHGKGEGTPWNSRMGKGRKPCCPVALLWGRAWGRRAGEWHMRIKNLQSRVNGNSCLECTTWPPQKGGRGGGRGMEQVAEMEASTQAAQKKLHHDSILSTVNLVPQH